MFTIGQRFKFDEQIYVAALHVESVASCRAKQFQPAHAVLAADVHNGAVMLSNRRVHIKIVARSVMAVKKTLGKAPYPSANAASNASRLGSKSSFWTNSHAPRAPRSRSMPEASHSTARG